MIHPHTSCVLPASLYRFLGLAAAADWTTRRARACGSRRALARRVPRAAKAAVELDRGRAAARWQRPTSTLLKAARAAALKNDLPLPVPGGADPLRAFVEGPDAAFLCDVEV